MSIRTAVDVDWYGETGTVRLMNGEEQSISLARRRNVDFTLPRLETKMKSETIKRQLCLNNVKTWIQTLGAHLVGYND